MSEDLTVTILIAIRDEIRSTREEIRDEIRSTNSRVDQTNGRLEQLSTDLRAEIALTRNEFRGELHAMELRNATRIAEQTASTRDLYTLLTGQLDLRDRVSQCEHEIEDLKKRGGRGGPRRIS